jgi:hypothetical protein
LTACSRSEKLPLSFAQERMWFINQMDQDSSAYHISMALHLIGALDVQALEQSLSEIIRRHEVLRTTFMNQGGQPVQIIAENAEFVLPVIDFTVKGGLPDKAEVRKLAKKEAQRPFDLSRDLLLRASLVRLGAEDHGLFLIMHHIVSDAWSMRILFHELSSLYAAYTRHEAAQLPPLPIQYADFATWQRAWLAGEALEEQLAYWKEQLQDAPAMLELPADRSRPAIQSGAGATLPFVFSKKLSDGLTELSRREGATLFMTLLAAFQTLLYR